MKEFISRKRVLFLTIISVLVVISLLYSTYAINVFVSETTPTTYDMALSFDLSSSVNMQITVEAGKTKVFDIGITNPYTDSIKYGIAYQMVAPTTKPDTVTIAKANISPYPAVGTIPSKSTQNISLVIENKSTSSTTVSLSVITGYKNGGDLIVPSGKTLVTDVYTLRLIDITIYNMPVPTGTYTVDTSYCEGITMTYDYTKKGFKISNVSTSDEILCSPTFTTTTRTTLSNHIKNTLTGTTQGNGQVVNENGYRYEGKNPNNYVMFNDELWRIIGVFDQTSHGQTGQYLTKIIREEPIGGLAWDKSNVNNWATSSLYNLLNTHYYNATDGTDSGYCYGYSSTVTTNCDYTTSGIQDEYRDMVKNVTWYLGGYSSYNVNTDNMYTYERSSDDTYYYTDNRSNKTVTGNIGLMYVSDYGYSVLSSSCARTTNVGSYNTNACAGNSWLYGNGHELTIGHLTSSSSNVFLVYYSGYMNNSNAHYGYASRPVLYLNSLVYIINGTGSKSDPYVIGM